MVQFMTQLGLQQRMATKAFTVPTVSRQYTRLVLSRASTDDPVPNFSASQEASTTEPEASSSMPEIDTNVDVEDSGMDIQDLKAALCDSIFGTDRGSSASSEVKAEIDDLLTQIEAKNPTSAPMEEGSKLLTGTWRLLYSSSPVMLGVLALGKVPTISVGPVQQTIDMDAMTITSKIEVSNLIAKSIITLKSTIEARSPKRYLATLTQTVASPPELLTTDIDAPAPTTLELGGQSFDTAAFQPVLEPLLSAVREVSQQIAQLLENAPDLVLPAGQEGGSDSSTAGVQIVVSYLDDSLRIVRLAGGLVYVFEREGDVENAEVVEGGAAEVEGTPATGVETAA